MTKNRIVLVSKITQRVMVYYYDSLNYADCYQAENVRDLDSWKLVQARVPDKRAHDWVMGNDLALESIR